MTLTELQAQRDAILKQISVARVQDGDRSLDLVTDKERALNRLDQEIAKLSAGSAPRVFTMQTKRGIES